MQVKVPNRIVDNSYTAFPRGNYDGTISGAAVRDPNNDGSWVLVKLSLEGITPREGTADPGRTNFSGDIVIRNTDKDTGEAQDLRELSEVNGNLHFTVERGAGLVAGLGAAVGAAERDETGVSVDLGAVIESLVDGAFEGKRIGFTVNNRKDKNDPTKIYDGFAAIGPSAS
jgi:hypothetical protein